MDVRRSFAPPSVIKNIQHITTMFSAQGSKAVTVASYNSAKTYFSPVGVQQPNVFIGTVSYDSSTQITVVLNGTASGAVAFDLIEFW